MSYETSTALLIITVIAMLAYFIVNLKEKELFPLRLLMFMIVFPLSSALLQHGINIAEANGASADIITLLTAPFYIMISITIIVFFYVLIAFIVYALNKAREIKVKNVDYNK